MSGKVEEYLGKLKSPQKEICERLKEIILEALPGISEEIKWGVPVYGGELFYIGALKDHVNLGFKIVGLSEEEIALFEGGGKTMRHIKIYALADIDKEKITRLLKMVKKQQKNGSLC